MAAPTESIVTRTTNKGPRDFCGANSAAIVPAMARSAPTATPIRVRSTMSCHASVAKNCSAESTTKHAKSAIYTFLPAELVRDSAEDQTAEEHAHQRRRA